MGLLEAGVSVFSGELKEFESLKNVPSERESLKSALPFDSLRLLGLIGITELRCR
jgi:hypothetical protein